MSDEETSHLVAKSEHPVISTESSVGNPATSRFSLLRVKFHYFAFFAGWGCLLPYLTLYYRYVGLSARQNGTVQSTRPFVNFLATPLWGAVGERFGGIKVIWIASLLLQIVLTWLIALVKPDNDVVNLQTSCYCGNHSNLSDHVWDAAHAHASVDNETLNILCQKMKQDSIDARKMKFLEIVGLVAIGEFFAAPGPPLTDHFTLEVLGNKRQGDYGKQRVWGTVGWGLASSAVSVGSQLGLKSSICAPDFSLYFYLFGGFTALSVVFAIGIAVGHKGDKGDHNHTKQQVTSFWFRLRLLLKNPKIVLFLLAAWLIGILMSVIENFLFWFIEDLGGGQTIMGLSVLVMSVGEIPAFILSGHVISWIGYRATLCLTFLCYAIRFIAYSFITIPWTVLPIELIHGVTFALRSAAIVSYARAVAPKGLEATTQTLFEGVLTGLGGGCGGVLGGLSWQNLGARTTFRISAAASGGGLILFLIGWTFISVVCPQIVEQNAETNRLIN
jgi:MFS family permease